MTVSNAILITVKARSISGTDVRPMGEIQSELFGLYNDSDDFENDSIRAFELCRIFVEWAEGNSVTTAYRKNRNELQISEAKEALQFVHSALKTNTIVKELKKSTFDEAKRPGSPSAKAHQNYCELLNDIPAFLQLAPPRSSLSPETCKAYMNEIKSYFTIECLRRELVRTPFPDYTSRSGYEGDIEDDETAVLGPRTDKKCFNDSFRNCVIS